MGAVIDASFAATLFLPDEASISHGLTAYDAVYLELAIRRGFVLLSLDAPLLKAARTLGVGFTV